MRKMHLVAVMLLLSSSANSQQIATGTTVTVPANGGSGGASASIWRADCKPGMVMTGIEIVVGGTCHNQCNADGRPVATYRIHCSQSPLGTPIRALRSEN